MPRTHRLTDCNSKGGCITTIPQGTVYANDLLVSVNGAQGTADLECSNDNIHCTLKWSTANGGPTVFAENIPINKEGDPDTCTHPRAGGSPNVFNDAFQGGGAMFDNNPPYGDDPPPGAQPSPPAEYENNTIATIYVLEHNDIEEDAGSGPPPNVNYEPLSEVETQPDQGAPNIPTVDICPDIDILLPDFNWFEEIGATTFEAWASTISLSSNFTVWDMCNGAVGRHEFSDEIEQNSGLTQQEILVNMCHHANIVLEPMRSTYGAFTITSGFRNNSGTSQHNIGQATDIQFLNLHTIPLNKTTIRQAYYDRAIEVRDNQNYDQFILEYFAINPWFHISSNPTNHRGKVNTQVSSAPSYAPGLVLLG